MANNKVQLSNGTVIIDLTSDTVTSASHIKSGLVGHLADGTTATGTLIEKDVKSVTYNLSGGATASISTSEVVTGQGFSVKLKAPAGYELSNVSITMGGVDITSQVFTPDEAGGGGGGSGQSITGTFTGNGGLSVQIPCSFDPDLIRVYGDLSGDVSLRGIVSLTFVKNDYMSVMGDSSSSAYNENLIYDVPFGMVGFNDTSLPHASYENGTLTIDMVTSTSSLRFASGITYTYKFVKWTT